MTEKSLSHIIITSPSLNAEDNVSGIANLTHLLKQYNTNANYIVFKAGKKDEEKRNIKWFFSQFYVLYSFFIKIKKKNIHLAHINMPLLRFSIIRDSLFSFLCWFFNKAYVLHFRGGKYSMNKNIPSFLKFFVRLSLRNASKVIVLGNEEKLFLINHYSIQENKISVLPNCVKIPEISAKKLPTHDKINILFLGRIDKKKGLKEAIDALGLLDNINYRFITAGDGEDRSWFLDYAEKKLQNKFIYKGIISGKKKNEILKSSHIFLLPSHYEGLPNALLEAMSYGMVPIVTPVGSIPEVVENEKNGLLVGINKPVEIKKCIELLVRQPSFYYKFSESARETVINSYSLNKYLEELNKIYLSLKS